MEYVVKFPGLGWEITINRVAFWIGDFPIYWYGVIIGVGLLGAFAYALIKSKEFGIDSDKLLDVALVSAAFAVIGARLYYIVFSPTFKVESFLDIIDIRDGGLGFYGAVVFALVTAYVLCIKWRKLKFLAVGDVAAIGFLIGQGVGRWGNFMNQEAFGTNTTLPWGMLSSETTTYLQRSAAELAERGIYVDPNMPVHPTFLYESLWCLLGFLLLALYAKRRKFDGEILLMYVAWNGIGRAFIEGLRTDSLYIGPIRVSQLVAVVGVLVATAVIVATRRKIKASDDPNYLVPYVHTAEWKQEYAAILERNTKANKAKAEAADDSVPNEAGDVVTDDTAESEKPNKQDEQNKSDEEK